MRAFLLAIALLTALPAIAQQDADARRTITALETLLKERPKDPTLWFYLARFQGEAGNRAAALAALEKVLEYGNGFLPPKDDFKSLWDDKEFQALRAKLEAKLPRLDYAPNAIELEDRMLIPEGIAFDPPSQSFFIGSVAQR